MHPSWFMCLDALPGSNVVCDAIIFGGGDTDWFRDCRGLLSLKIRWVLGLLEGVCWLSARFFCWGLILETGCCLLILDYCIDIIKSIKIYHHSQPKLTVILKYKQHMFTYSNFYNMKRMPYVFDGRFLKIIMRYFYV